MIGPFYNAFFFFYFQNDFTYLCPWVIRKTLPGRQGIYCDLCDFCFTNDPMRFTSISPKVMQLKSDSLKRKPQVI